MQFPALFSYWRQYCSLWRQHWRTFHFIIQPHCMVISSVLDCESVWTLTVDILNIICNPDCFAECSLDLTLIVSFWKIAFLVRCWKQIIISRSWNWSYCTHLQYSTQCSNGCQCVLCHFQWFLFSIMSVTACTLLRGGGFFRDTALYRPTLCPKKVNPLMFDNNFGKCGPIFKILSPTNSWENSPCIHHRDFHLTCSMLLQYRVKFKNFRMLPYFHTERNN